ncbi:MAG: hypothetical protein UU05_C0008G0003 [Candidatus Curtissbacteria bacterium GW2011_GWA1_40_47]|nr:MAG: hypothetical protein UU05_C0008G0003 [Candidatus Curtissbacteria bacterium GW2011_GWA1_40_47]
MVGQDGKTNVTQKIVLKNKTSNYYAEKFELKIGSTKVEDVKATDNIGPLETNVKFDQNTTSIEVKFNQKVIGIGKTLPWELTYTSSELATKSGQIWEISIPRLAKAADIGAYKANISVPSSFGPVAFTIPQPKTTNKALNRQEFSFDKEQLIQTGIAMSFGQKQVFSFKLNYFLQNNNLTNQFSQIALPPDNNYQKIVIEKIEPNPVNIDVDKDGNLLAKYKLAPHSDLDVEVSGFVEVFSKPFRKINAELSQEEKELYTQPQKYWDTANAQIKETASTLKTPEQIYDFVTTTLSYSKERLSQPKIERLGAAGALQFPKDAVCMEFTDLFIALARASHLPAREVEGFAYTQNERLRPLSLTLPEGDILHAWPEYWDDELGWVQVDPTWGSTSGGLDYFSKLDFNHITFVQRGVSSTSPYPAGSYKREEDSQKKGVFVSFAQDLPTLTATPQLLLLSPQKIISAFPVKVQAKVSNVGSTSLIGQKISLSTGKLKNLSSGDTEIPILPPFSTREFEFNLQANALFLNTEDTLILSYADSQISKPIRILPIYQIFFFKSFSLSILIAIIICATSYFIYKKIKKSKVKLPAY